VELKLKEMLDYIHNYFVMDVYEGKIKIENHQIDNSKIELFNGQYFMVKGSIFNDGIWRYDENLNIDLNKDENDDYLTDEEFEGEIYLLAIPRDVLAICEEIKGWEAKNQDTLNGIYQSESFGGYSYSLKSGKSNKNGSNESLSWKDVFGSRLKAYRKLS
jgi:hypothetical protein